MLLFGHMSSPKDALERAREHCFFAGVGDSGMELCEALVPYGVAKIHAVQETLGHAPDAVFVGAPDATVTRNVNRWKQGFGYGGSYAWSGDFAVLDIKSNACGMLVGALDGVPPVEEVRERARRLKEGGLELDGIELDYDLEESNHFVDAFEVTSTKGAPIRDAGGAAPSIAEEAPLGAKAFFIMHSSGHEHRAPSVLGPGLYYDESEELRKSARVIETPWGECRVLVGADAAQWFQAYARIQDFNHRRREAVAKALFGDFRAVVNETHQGLVRGLNRANVGVYTYDAPGELFPLTLSATLPAYLVRGHKNVTAPMMTSLGWDERARRHGLAERLKDTNLLPHGGGYKYPKLRKVVAVHEGEGGARKFELAYDGATKLIETPRELEYVYRGPEVLHRMTALGLGSPVVELTPRWVL